MGRYEIDTDDSKVVQIKVVGVGGGGGNAVNIENDKISDYNIKHNKDKRKQ